MPIGLKQAGVAAGPSIIPHGAPRTPWGAGDITGRAVREGIELQLLSILEQPISLKPALTPPAHLLGFAPDAVPEGELWRVVGMSHHLDLAVWQIDAPEVIVIGDVYAPADPIDNNGFFPGSEPMVMPTAERGGVGWADQWWLPTGRRLFAAQINMIIPPYPATAKPAFLARIERYQALPA